MWKDNLVFYKSKSYFNICSRIGVHKKTSPRLSTNLYDQVYFNRWDHSNPSMGLSNTGSDHSGHISQ